MKFEVSFYNWHDSERGGLDFDKKMLQPMPLENNSDPSIKKSQNTKVAPKTS